MEFKAAFAKAYDNAQKVVNGQGDLSTVLAETRGQGAGSLGVQGGIIAVFTVVIVIILMGTVSNKIALNVPVDNDIFGVISSTESFGPTITIFGYLVALVVLVSIMLYVIRRTRG